MRHRLTLAPILAVLLLAGCGGSTNHPAKRGYHTRYGLQAHSPTFGLHPKGVPLPPPLSRTEAAQTLLMLDSVDTTANSSTWNGIHPVVVAGYLPPSSWPTFVPYLSEFPHAIHVAYDVQSFAFGDHRAAINCLDDEPGDATPSQAGPWVVHEVHAGFRPCVYFSLSNRSAVESSVNSSLAGAHLHVHVYYDCADWTFFAHLDPGCDAVQWSDHYLGRNIDASTVDAAFVGKGITPTKPSVRCYHKGWPVPTTDKTLCLKVRAHDAFLGQQRSRKAAFLKVTQANEAAIQAKLTPIAKQLVVVESRIAVEVRKHEWTALSVSAANAAKLGAQAAPLEHQLAPLQARAKLETSRESSDNTQLHADLRKYGFN